MAEVFYNGNKVNGSVQALKSVNGRIRDLSSRVKGVTSSLVSCKGFELVSAGVTNSSFSGNIDKCSNDLGKIISNVEMSRSMILDYNNEGFDVVETYENDDAESKKFNWKGLGLGEILDKGFTSLGATVCAASIGIFEGVAEFLETGADLIELGKSAVGTIFTGTYDLVTGSDTTKKMWEDTMAKVSEKHVENAFNNFYENTALGQAIKEEAIAFDTVRSISSGLGYTAGMIGLNIATGGIAGGLGTGVNSVVNGSQLAAIAGSLGFARATEDAWADGASLEDGLKYGVASGAWEAAQWAIGAKINNVATGGAGLASNVFKGGLRGLVTRTVLEAADAGVEGFVQPRLSMLYKDYEGSNIMEKYKNAFNQAGGWENVRNQAIMGGIMSFGSEAWDARNLLNTTPQTNSSLFNGKNIDYDSPLYKGISEVYNSNGIYEFDEVDGFYGYSTVKNMLDNVDDAVMQARAQEIFSSYKISDTVKDQILSSDGYSSTIRNILDQSTRLSNVQKTQLADMLSSKVFAETNAARVRAQYDIFNGDYDRALGLVSSSSKPIFDQYTDLFVATESYSPDATRHLYYHIIDEGIDSGLTADAAISQAKLMYANAMDRLGDESSKQMASNLFKSNSQLFGISSDVLEGYEFLETGRNTSRLPNYYVIGDRIAVDSLSEDFDFLIKGDSALPYYVTSYDPVRTAKAKSVFVDSFDEILRGEHGSQVEAARVMSRLIELDRTPGLDNIFVYNNNGLSCSHQYLNTINLGNEDIDLGNFGVVHHEAGHYLFSNVLGDQVPEGFSDIRVNAVSSYRGAENASLISGVKDAIREARIYSDYKAVQMFKDGLSSKGFSGIDDYKKYLYNQYASSDEYIREQMLRDSVIQSGDSAFDSFTKNYSYVDYTDAAGCASLDYNSSLSRIQSAVNYSNFHDLIKTSSIIDSVTAGEDCLWYGHPTEYFNSWGENKNGGIYHELIADYTALKLDGDNKTLGFLRNLFGDGMMDMLDKTYQDMLG